MALAPPRPIGIWRLDDRTITWPAATNMTTQQHQQQQQQVYLLGAPYQIPAGLLPVPGKKLSKIHIILCQFHLMEINFHLIGNFLYFYFWPAKN